MGVLLGAKDVQSVFEMDLVITLWMLMLNGLLEVPVGFRYTEQVLQSLMGIVQNSTQS